MHSGVLQVIVYDEEKFIAVRGLDMFTAVSSWLIKQVKGPADHRLLFRQSERD
jgi:hypothetical protein